MKLKDMRRARGWSQEQLVEISGVSVRNVQRLEKDELPVLETQKAIAAAFDQTLEEFSAKKGIKGASLPLPFPEALSGVPAARV